jgi:hypothetical protein
MRQRVLGRRCGARIAYTRASVAGRDYVVDKLRAFLVEDSPIVVETLTAALEEIAAVNVVGYACTEQEALSWFGSRTDGCDVAVIDIFLQSGTGFGVLKGDEGLRPATAAGRSDELRDTRHARPLRRARRGGSVRQVHRGRGIDVMAPPAARFAASMSLPTSKSRERGVQQTVRLGGWTCCGHNASCP